MQLRTAFLKSSALRGFKNGDGKASKNGEAKGCVEGRNLRRRRARSTSAAAGRAPASDADIPASSSSHSFSENTTVTTLTPQSSQGVPSPCRDQDGSLLPSLPPLPPLPLTGRYLTPGTPERGKSAPPTSFCRGSRRGDRGLEDAPDSGRAYGGGGVGRESVLDREDTSVEEKVDELLSEMSDLLVGEREHRYGVDGDSCVVELLDESSDDSDFDWLERVRSFYASEDCCVPATKKPDNPYEAYRVRQERARASHEACEGVGGKEASSAMGNSMKASVRRNRDVVEPESVHGGLTSSSLARAQETEQRAKSVFMRWPEGTRKEVGEEGHRTWWSRLRNGSDGSAASVGSGGFFGQALSALAAATSFDASLQAPTVTPGSSRASREGTNDWDAAGGRSRSGGGGSGSRTTARERETSITENVSDRRCDESLIKGVAVPNARIDKAGGTADRGAGVVTVLKRQAGEEGEQSRMTGIKQQAALVASMRDCETPSRSRRLLLESPFFRKAKGLSDLKKILGTEELREGFRQASDVAVPSSLPGFCPLFQSNLLDIFLFSDSYLRQIIFPSKYPSSFVSGLMSRR